MRETIQQGTLNIFEGYHNRKVDLKRLIGVYKTTKARGKHSRLEWKQRRIKARQSEVKLSSGFEMERYSHD